MALEDTNEAVDSSATATVETTEANADSKPTEAAPVETVQDQVSSQELAERKAFEKATGRKWKEDAGEPEGDDQAKPEAKAEVKDEPAKVELSDRAKKQITELGISEDDALAKAITAFERHKFGEDEIEARLSKGEKRFIEDGLELAKQQRDVDSAFGRLGQLEKRVTPQDKPSEPLTIPADVTAEIDKVLAPLADDPYLADSAPVFRQMVETVSKIYEAKAQQQQQAVEAMHTQLREELQQVRFIKVGAAIEQTRAKLLGEKFPQLKDQASHDKVLKMYDTFVDSRRYEDKTPEEVYSEAADLVLGKEQATTFSQALAQRHLDRKKSQPALPTNKAPSVAAMSQDAKDQLALNRIKRELKSKAG